MPALPPSPPGKHHPAWEGHATCPLPRWRPTARLAVEGGGGTRKGGSHRRQGATYGAREGTKRPRPAISSIAVTMAIIIILKQGPDMLFNATRQRRSPTTPVLPIPHTEHHSRGPEAPMGMAACAPAWHPAQALP